MAEKVEFEFMLNSTGGGVPPGAAPAAGGRGAAGGDWLTNSVYRAGVAQLASAIGSSSAAMMRAYTASANAASARIAASVAASAASISSASAAALSSVMSTSARVSAASAAAKGDRQGGASAGSGGVSAGVAAASAAALGVIASGNPMGFATLIGSFRMLAIEAASILTPAILRLSAAIQACALWVRGLDTETKRNLASWAVWAVAVGAAVLIGARLIGMAVAVGRAFVTMGSLVTGAISGVGRALMANPILLAMLAIVAAVGAAGYAINRWSTQNSRSVQESIQARAELSGGPLTTSQWERLDPKLRQRVLETAPEHRAAIMRAQIANNEARLRAMAPEEAAVPGRVAAAQAEVARVDAAMTPTTPAGIGAASAVLPLVLAVNSVRQIWGNRRVDEARAPAAAAERIRTENAVLQAAITGGIPGTGGAGDGRARLLLAGAQVEARSFSGGEEYMDNVTLGAIGRGPLDQEIQRGILRNTLDTAREAGEINRKTPVLPSALATPPGGD